MADRAAPGCVRCRWSHHTRARPPAQPGPGRPGPGAPAGPRPSQQSSPSTLTGITSTAYYEGLMAFKMAFDVIYKLFLSLTFSLHLHTFTFFTKYFLPLTNIFQCDKPLRLCAGHVRSQLRTRVPQCPQCPQCPPLSADVTSHWLSQLSGHRLVELN